MQHTHPLALIAVLLFATHAACADETGSFRISTQPGDAVITINGKPKGNSPEDSGQALVVKLPEGQYTIEAYKAEGDYIYQGKKQAFLASGVEQPINLKLDAQLTDAAKAAQQAEAERKKAAEGKGVIVKGKLMWMRCAMGQTWTGSTCTGNANEYTWYRAKDLRHTFTGYSDWRLPTREELLSIRYCSNGVINKTSDNGAYSACADGYQKPTINSKDFPNTPDRPFWSASPGAAGTDLAWDVDFRYGSDGWGSKDNYIPVRLVRGQ